MERLTNEHGGGFKACNGCIKPHCKECEEFIRQCAVLCDYENTGYTPAEILLSNTSLEILVTLVRENQTFKDLVSKIPFDLINSWLEAYADGRLIVLPKKSNQPLFVKDDAIDIFNYWNNTTGAISNGTSYYYEAHAVIEEIAAMAFGAGMMYQDEIANLRKGKSHEN